MTRAARGYSGAMPPALFDVFPSLADNSANKKAIRYRPLGLFPTPIERVYGPFLGDCELWVKREDKSGALYGGNKVRRLEFLLAEVEKGDRLLTFGAYGSNHVLATGIYGRALGCTVEAVIYPQPLMPRVRTALLADLGAGVVLHPCRTYFGVPIELLRARRRAPPARLLTPGMAPLGTLGWWSGGLEIAAQVACGVAPRFDVVYVALGSGDTTAGLLLGLGEAASELVGVRVVPWPLGTAPAVELLVQSTRSLLARHMGTPLAKGPRPTLRTDGRFVGRGYGHPTPAGAAAIARAADLGLTLDTTYTGKVFAAICADAQSGRLRGKRVLFINSLSSTDPSSLLAAGERCALPPWLVARLDKAEKRCEAGAFAKGGQGAFTQR